MGWIFPTSSLQTGTVLDWLEFDEQIALFANKVNGWLGEHNLKSNIGTPGSDLISQDKVEPNVAIRAFNTAHLAAPMTAANPDFISIPMTDQWFAITESELEVKGPGGRVVVIASFQVIVENHVALADIGPGLQFALQVDDNERMESLLGSGDLGNERFPSDDDDPGTLPLAGGTSMNGPYDGGRVQGAFLLDAGVHTVRLVARNPFVLRSGTIPEQYVGCVEMIALHTWT